jgi:hypothetical protein
VSRFFRQLALAAALGLAAAAPVAGQGYGPVLAPLQHYEMYRGDALDIEIGKAFDWVEVDSEAVAAFMREGEKLRIVAVKPGAAQVVLTNDDKVVWRAEVVVR